MAKQLPGKKTISVILPEEIFEAVRSLAEEKDWSVSQTAKNLIVKALQEQTSNNRQ